MSKETILKHLQDNVRAIYHKAVDADTQIEQLREQKKAGFKQIFSADTPFISHSDTFLSYVEELAADLNEFEMADEESYKELLPNIVLKIELLFKMLMTFKSNLK